MKAKSMMRKSRIGIMFSVVAILAAMVLCMGCNGKEQTSGTVGDAAETIDTGAEITETEAGEIIEEEANKAEEETGQEETSAEEEADTAEEERGQEETSVEEETGTAEEETGQEEASAEEEAAAADSGPYADEIAAITAASVGDIVYFGNYEQDNNTSNGKEPVAWYVLDKSGGEATLLSVYLLDNQPYHEDWGNDITWEECTLRSWLNGTFYNAAFSVEEQAAVVNTNVVNADNPYYGTKGGRDTMDKVWLLSLGEVEKYFHIDMMDTWDDFNNGNMDWHEYAIYCYGQDNRVCAKPTVYGSRWTFSEEEAQYEMDNYGYDMSYAIGSDNWWLRSLGIDSTTAAYVSYDGNVCCYILDVENSNGVRPALKVAY